MTTPEPGDAPGDRPITRVKVQNRDGVTIWMHTFPAGSVWSLNLDAIAGEGLGFPGRIEVEESP